MQCDVLAPGDCVLGQLVDRGDGQPGQAKTDGASHGAEQAAFNKQLPHQPQLACSQGGPNRKLLLTAQAPGNQ